MKKILVLLFVAFSLIAEAQVVTPAASTASTVTNVIGLTDVKIEYSRPKAKGRKIYGEGDSFLTPYGKLWRTAANNGSRITFSDDVKFGGKDVPKGTYLLLTIPGAAEWTVILYKDVAMGGNTDQYDQSKDQVRVTAKSEKLTEKVETFTLGISDIAENSKSGNLQITWENTSVKVPIAVEFDAKIMAAIDNNIPDNLFAAASYYYQNGKDLKKALGWINEAAAANPKAFWVTLQKARIQKALGDKKGAMETSMASKAAAQEAKNDAYVKMNDELMATLK